MTFIAGPSFPIWYLVIFQQELTQNKWLQKIIKLAKIIAYIEYKIISHTKRLNFSETGHILDLNLSGGHPHIDPAYAAGD